MLVFLFPNSSEIVKVLKIFLKVNKNKKANFTLYFIHKAYKPEMFINISEKPTFKRKCMYP